MKLYWVICKFEKYGNVTNIDFEKLTNIAKEHDFDVEFAYISKIPYEKKDDIEKVYTNTSSNVHFYMFKKLHTENECIYKALSFFNADRYFVCDARYLEMEETIHQMLHIASFYGMNFVRCKKEYDGIFVAPYKIIKNFHNRIVRLFADTKNNKYIRNLCIFDSKVYHFMEKNPSTSAIIRETDFLVNVQDCIVTPPEKMKKAKHYVENWTSFLVSATSLFLSLWCIICLAILKPNFNLFTWLIVGIIIFGVIGILGINYSIARNKIIYYKPFAKREKIEAVLEYKGQIVTFEQSKEENKDEEANENFATDKSLTNNESTDIKEEDYSKKTTKKKNSTKKDKKGTIESKIQNFINEEDA